MASLTREEMEAEIRQGRSILFSPTAASPGGAIAASMEALPSQAALAAASNDPIRKAAALAAIDAQRKALDEQEALLHKPAPKPEPETAKAEPVKVESVAHAPGHAPAKPHPAAESPHPDHKPKAK